PNGPELASLATEPEDLDVAFNESWRDELLARAWEALAEAKPGLYTVLRFRATHPDLGSAELAERLGRQQGKPLTAAAFRQTLHRARDHFAMLLVDEVARSLEAPTAEQVEQELRDLNLLSYCREALRRRGF